MIISENYFWPLWYKQLSARIAFRENGDIRLHCLVVFFPAFTKTTGMVYLSCSEFDSSTTLTLSFSLRHSLQSQLCCMLPPIMLEDVTLQRSQNQTWQSTTVVLVTLRTFRPSFRYFQTAFCDWLCLNFFSCFCASVLAFLYSIVYFTFCLPNHHKEMIATLLPDSPPVTKTSWVYATSFRPTFFDAEDPIVIVKLPNISMSWPCN